MIRYTFPRLVSLSYSLAVEDHGTTGSTKTLVSGCRDDVRVWERRWNCVSSNETTDVGHVSDEVSTDFVGNFLHALVVDQSAVSACSRDKDLGSVEGSTGFKSIIVNDSSVLVDAIWHSLKVRRDGRNLLGIGLVTFSLMTTYNGALTMRKMSTVRKIQSHESPMRRHQRLVHFQIGW